MSAFLVTLRYLMGSAAMSENEILAVWELYIIMLCVWLKRKFAIFYIYTPQLLMTEYRSGRLT